MSQARRVDQEKDKAPSSDLKEALFDQIDDQLRRWAERLPGNPSFSLAPPRDDQPGSGASFYLLELVDAPPLRSAGRPPLQLSLRYLVTTWAETPGEAHRFLGDLVFAAMNDSEFDVDLTPVPSATWVAFGVIPRPAFFLSVKCRKEQPESPAPLIREPMVLQSAPLVNISGTVLGPGDVPLMMATVELPSLHRSTRTDSKGRFHFTSVPGEDFTKHLRIRTKGRDLDVMLDKLPTSEDPLVIHFDLLD
ncbi:MAG: hypothetical protein WD490_07210 [Opitutales bacterium]